MQISEKVLLKWDDLQSNWGSSFSNFRRDEELSDVTLASQDGSHVKCHKVIVASSSPFFTEKLLNWKKRVESRRVPVEPSHTVFSPVNVTNPDELDRQIRSMMKITREKLLIGKNQLPQYLCEVCEKKGQMGNILMHIEANHIATNNSHPCNVCGKSSRFENLLRLHTNSNYSSYSLGPEMVWGNIRTKITIQHRSISSNQVCSRAHNPCPTTKGAQTKNHQFIKFLVVSFFSAVEKRSPKNCLAVSD